MKLGMPTLIEFNSLEENIELCKAIGLDFIELNVDLPYCFPEKIKWEEVNKYKNIELTVHLSEKIEIGDINEFVRKQQIKLIERQILMFKQKANIRKYNLHLNKGIYFTLPDEKFYIYEKYKNEYLKAINNSFKELSKFALEQSVDICFENTSTTPVILQAFKKIINYPNLYYTLDIGHNIKDGEKAEKLFMENPLKIKHLHIHDSDSKTDHLELGTGILDIKKYIKFCEINDIYAVIEVKRRKDLEKSIYYLKNAFIY